MSDFIRTLLQAVIIAIVPVCAMLAVKGIKALETYFGAKTDNATVRRYLSEVADAVSTAVTYVSQVYVDALKKYGEFSEEEQKEALRMAVEKALDLLSKDVLKFLDATYSDVIDNVLITLVEAEVRRQKNGVVTLTS